MNMSYDTAQLLLIVFCALIVIGFVLWLFGDYNSSKRLSFTKAKMNQDEE